MRSLALRIQQPGLIFDALNMTGFGAVASNLGLPDAGYGGLLNMQQTVLGSERAGAVAIEIED